jgi:hypothetical protein
MSAGSQYDIDTQTHGAPKHPSRALCSQDWAARGILLDCHYCLRGYILTTLALGPFAPSARMTASISRARSPSSISLQVCNDRGVPHSRVRDDQRSMSRSPKVVPCRSSLGERN